jgi:dethiobiotin synthetase
VTPARLVVTGTDTGIGKTVFAAGLTALLGGCYWKPVQAGLDGETDSATVARLAAVGEDRILVEAYRLRRPASPHHAAAAEGVSIAVEALVPPTTRRPLIIEGAGGVMVPLTSTMTFADVFANWCLPVVLCARTGLGTINHTLLSLEALRNRGVAMLGVAFVGDAEPVAARAIAEIGRVRILGRLPQLRPLTASSLQRSFASAFRAADFLTGV